MAQALRRRSTSPGIGRAAIEPATPPTLPAMEAVGAPPESVGRCWARFGHISICDDEFEGVVPLSDRALELLRRTVPRVLQSNDELEWAPLDHRDGFVLSLIDGRTSVQVLIDVAGMPESELIALLQRLRGLEIITLG